jgi:tetratricopeptide (TPR) repeat protein
VSSSADGRMTSRAAGPSDPDAYAALEEQRDFLLASLDDLERERTAGDIDEHDYEALRDDYTARAAAVLRALEAGGARYAAAPRRGSRRLAAAVLAAVLVLGIGAGILVARSSGSRTAGEEATGDVRLDVRELLAEAQQRLAEQEVLEAVMLYDQVLELQPDNVEALTYRGWALVLSTLVDDGLGYLRQAVEVDPTYPDARIFLARTLEGLGRIDAARRQLDAVDEDQVPVAMRPLVDGLRQRLEATAPGEQGGTG